MPIQTYLSGFAQPFPDCLHSLEHLVLEALFDVLPDLFTGIELRCIGGYVDQEYVFRDLYVLCGMEPGIVNDHHFVLLGPVQ